MLATLCHFELFTSSRTLDCQALQMPILQCCQHAPSVQLGGTCQPLQYCHKGITLPECSSSSLTGSPQGTNHTPVTPQDQQSSAQCAVQAMSSAVSCHTSINAQVLTAKSCCILGMAARHRNKQNAIACNRVQFMIGATTAVSH